MPSPKKDRPSDAPKPKAVRRSDDAPVADTAKATKRAKPDAASESRTPPPNARVVKFWHKPGTVSRRAVRAAIKRLQSQS